MSRFSETLERLNATIAARVGADPASSYTAKLLAGGPAVAGKKFGEEAVETVIAAVQADPDAVAAESADLIYHWLVLLAAAGVPLEAVAAKLEAREGQSADIIRPSPPRGEGLADHFKREPILTYARCRIPRNTITVPAIPTAQARGRTIGTPKM